MFRRWITPCACARLPCRGLLNRAGPNVFLDYGIYDDPAARRTNEVFLDDELWFGKYRDLLGYQDRHNLEYYREAHGFNPRSITLEQLIRENIATLNGYVVWDPTFDDTANIALMLSAQKNLLPITPEMEPWAQQLGLTRTENLVGRWKDRVELYQWAFENLFQHVRTGQSGQCGTRLAAPGIRGLSGATEDLHLQSQQHA